MKSPAAFTEAGGSGRGKSYRFVTVLPAGCHHQHWNREKGTGTHFARSLSHLFHRNALDRMTLTDSSNEKTQLWTCTIGLTSPVGLGTEFETGWSMTWRKDPNATFGANHACFFRRFTLTASTRATCKQESEVRTRANRHAGAQVLSFFRSLTTGSAKAGSGLQSPQSRLHTRKLNFTHST